MRKILKKQKVHSLSFFSVSELNEAFISREKEWRERIRKLEDEIAHFEYSQTREYIFEEARLKFEEDKTKMIHEHNKVIKQKYEEYSKQLADERHENEKTIEKILSEAKKNAEDEVQGDLMKMKEEIKALKDQLLIYQKELKVYEKEKERVVDQNKSFKKNFSIQEDSALEYQAVNYRQANKIKKLKEKNQLLKSFIAQVSIVIVS